MFTDLNGSGRPLASSLKALAPRRRREGTDCKHFANAVSEILCVFVQKYLGSAGDEEGRRVLRFGAAVPDLLFEPGKSRDRGRLLLSPTSGDRAPVKTIKSTHDCLLRNNECLSYRLCTLVLKGGRYSQTPTCYSCKIQYAATLSRRLRADSAGALSTPKRIPCGMACREG